MDKNERKKLDKGVEQAVYDAMNDPKYWARRRAHWDEWGSPVGLAIWFALCIISVGIFLYLLRLSGLI